MYTSPRNLHVYQLKKITCIPAQVFYTYTTIDAAAKQGCTGAAQTLQYRNKLLKTWAASIEAISFVDFDAMSRDAHHPASCDSDIHWMCWLKWAGRKQASRPILQIFYPAASLHCCFDRTGSANH